MSMHMHTPYLRREQDVLPCGSLMLFQDEADEASSPQPFQDEPEEHEHVLFQDEPPEPEVGQNRGSGSQHVAVTLFRDEPDEDQQPPQIPFGVEDDEASDDSNYLADDEETGENFQSLVQLSFTTMNQFLMTNLLSKSKEQAVAPAKKNVGTTMTAVPKQQQKENT